MKTAFEILKRDLLALVKNPIALLVVGALLVLPGLYAWYCIIANWDPYSHTGNMPVAIVNSDKGTQNKLAGEINIGDQVAEKLKSNDSINWKFYDSVDEALEDTRLANVYATIVLPEDLSENLLGIFTGSDKQPTIYYYPNEKYNAVATKVTDSAAQTLVRQINQNFASTVNQKILESARDVSDKVEARVDDTNTSVLAELRSVQADVDKVIASLDDATSAIAGWREAANGAGVALDNAIVDLPNITTLLAQGSDQLGGLRTRTDEFENQLSATILKSSTAISDMSGKASTAINDASKDLKVLKSDLEAIWAAADSDGDAELRLAAARLNIAISLLDGIVKGADERIAELNTTVQNMSGTVNNATSRISGEVMPQLSSGANSLTISLSKLSGTVNQFQPDVVGLRGVLTQTDNVLSMAEGSVADAKSLLSSISSNLRGTANDIGAIGTAIQIDSIKELLDISPNEVGTFISSPVQMVTEKICPVSNYGTAVAPFYTNLALWIGCFILVSLMKVEVMGFAGATARERYFGRLLLFIILSLLQSQVICGVDMLIGIDHAHPVLFMLAGAVCSFAYMNLIYALVKTFRNIGKTLCIFLLIMQVPGSSGMYPIQMMPDFFQFIHPALPFTYGIDAMREALSGIYGFAYVGDLAILLLIVPGSLLIGLGLRILMSNVLLLFDEEMNKVGFFASEEYEEGMERDGVRGMMRALRANEAYADDIEERAWRFNRVYPRLRKIGTIAAFAIPFALLVLMLPFNILFDLDVNVKLTVLIIMLIVLFVVQIALIVLEHTHRAIEAETRLIGSDLLDGFDLDLFNLDNESTSNESGQSAGMIPATNGLHAKKPVGNPAKDIFTTDVKLGFQSVVGVVVIVLLAITPSMYAWFNIAGSWDPYSATGNLKVAVANEDEGYKGDLLPLTINIGNTVESQLRGNSGFDWTFVDSSAEAVEGVESSKYYAAIVIPKGFSASILTYLTEDAEYPNVVYYTNEKENPIAPIITQKGATSIQESIRVSFTESVDNVALGVAFDVLDYVKNPNMSAYISKMSRHLDDALSDTRNTSSNVKSLSGLMMTTASAVSTLGAVLDNLQGTVDSAKSAVADARTGAQSAGASFDSAVSVVQDVVSGRDIDFNEVKGTLDRALDLLKSGADSVPASIDERINEFEEIINKEGVSESAKEKAQILIEDLREAKNRAYTASSNIDDAKLKTDAIVTDAQSELDAARAYFNDTVTPSIGSLRSSLGDITSSASGIIGNLDGVTSGLGGSTGGLSNQLNSLSSGLTKAGDKLANSATKIEDIRKRVADALKSGDLKQIEDIILGNDPETLAKNMAAPVTQTREPVYSVANYGSAMASFYTVLSLWVGALVMISTMRAHVVEERIEELRQRYGKVRPRHEFFGRYGIFGLIGLLQSTLVLLGDLFLLHIQCVHPVLFFVFGIFVGQVFCLIVYTITELFGDVGKALCVILLIMQVAASGGTFPVEMFDPILLNVAGFLPFYYAGTLLLECVSGILWQNVFLSIAALLIMAGFMIILGLPLRRPFRKVNDFFEEQLEKTGYM